MINVSFLKKMYIYRMKIQTSFLFFFLAFFMYLNGNGQEIIEIKSWISMGPNQAPDNAAFRPDAGVGPVEFIRVYQKKPGFLLAGSLSGGLFFSENGGDSWQLTGSDAWSYTGCPWADFYPTDENIWFACSNLTGENGKPGRIGADGGLLRSTNRGKTWQLIGGFKDFEVSTNAVIYGTRFHPLNPNLILVLTSNGLYYSENCLDNFVKWKRVPNVHGLVYDLDFMNGHMFVSNFYQNKWNVLNFDQDNFQTYFASLSFAEEVKPMRNVTFEPQVDHLLVAKDFTKDKDELVVLYPENDSLFVLLENQQIGFGSGHTFAVSPYDPGEFYLGHSTRIRKIKPPYKRLEIFGNNYHVDLEFVAYDPFDSLKIYIATHGGVFISIDGGEHWENKSVNMGITEVMGMAVSKSDPNQIVVGSYHDGSMLRADFDQNGTYTWRTINGGDGLLPLIDPNNNAVVFTSNQYVGGGLFYSNDTGLTSINLHENNKLKTAGWETAVVMDHQHPNTIFFNFVETAGFNNGNINVCRITDATQKKNAEVLSDFNASHQMKTYKVYGLYNSPFHPNTLIAYVLDYVSDKDGNLVPNHRLFRTDLAHGNPKEVRESWYELEHPNNMWIADVEIDGQNSNRLFLSYGIGNENPESIFGDRGMIYQLRYFGSGDHGLKRQLDISKNIPSGVAGRYNMAYSNKNGGTIFIATVTGVYFGDKRTLKGKSRWQKIGNDLPHCKVYGLLYNEAQEVLTVGLFGRGVWQYQF